MYFELTPEQQALQDDVRAYFERLITPELRIRLAAAMDGEGDRELQRSIIRQIGSDGWLGVGWPTEYGGRGWGPVEQYLFYEESMTAGAPVPLLALNTVGPAIMQFGTAEQKARFLPAILRGELHVAIGYTEPDAGTDLASLKTRAVRDGDEYVINGQKLFTTQANFAEYIWLAARTDPEAPRHKGITIFLVDTSLPGFKVTPIHTLMGRTNATYYDDVRVPATAVVGEVNGGWKMITTQLNYERTSIVSAGTAERVLNDVVQWAQEAERLDGGRVLDAQWVQMNLARVKAKLDALKMMNWRVAWSMANGTFSFADASSVKVFGTELYVEAYHLLQEVVGERAYLKAGSPAAVAGGLLERLCRQAVLTTFGGGVNEIQRDIIAMAGLGMPRSPR